MADTTRARPQRVDARGAPRPALSPPREGAKAEGGVLVPQPDRWDVPLELWALFVHYARRYRGLSQMALARAADVSQQTISKVEAGNICPHDRLKVRLAEALDVRTADLFPWPSQLVWTAADEVAWPILSGVRGGWSLMPDGPSSERTDSADNADNADNADAAAREHRQRARSHVFLEGRADA